MPSRESVSDEIRARTEFAAAVRNGIDALMGRCGFSRERATLALLKELNRGNGPDCKPTDEEIFDAMRRYKLGLDEANRAIVVGRAMRRELLFRGENNNNRKTTPLEAIQKLTSKLSLDNILYESGEDDSDDDGQSEILPLKIPKISRVASSSSLNRSSSTSSTNSIASNLSTTSTRKNARSKKNTLVSPRKQLKSSLRNKGNNNSSNSNTILVGRKRSIEDMDPTKQNAEVDAKAASSRPQLRASKRLHRSSASTDASVSSGLASKK
jgi:hypothetical protein